MAIDVEQRLTDAFEAASCSVAPASDLASMVRRRVRARRRVTAGVGAGLVIVLGTVIGIVASGSPGPPVPVSTIEPPRLQIPVRDVNAMAVGGGTLYVANGDHPGGALTAYDGATGHRIAVAHLPSRPQSVAVGAGGSVWVTFYPSNLGGKSGVSEFSPDLARHATVMTDNTYLDSGNFDVLPTGRRSALLATDSGVVTLRMPALADRPPVAANRSNASIDRSFVLPTSLAKLPHGNVAVLLSNDDGKGRVVRLHGAGSIDGQGLAMAGGPNGLWVTSTAPRSLRLYDSALSPEPVRLGSQVARAISVWTSGHTVWAETGGVHINLTCFAFTPGRTPRPVTVPLPRVDSTDQTYPLGTLDLTVVPTPTVVYVAGPARITSDPVPPACA